MEQVKVETWEPGVAEMTGVGRMNWEGGRNE